MTEVPRTTPPVGRIRRVIGFVFIALGILILARVGWLGALYGRWFGHDEWVRFAGWLWLGIVFALIGWWLVNRSRAARWAVVLAVVALFLMAYVHDRWLR
jgi:hypothetical protein